MIIVISTCVEVTQTQFFERNLNYELSDGTTLTVVAKRFRCVEVFLMTQSSNRSRNLTYELPDGNILTVVVKRFRCEEVFLMTQSSNRLEHKSISEFDLRAFRRKHPCCCRQALPMRGSVAHDKELKSIAEFDRRAFRRKHAHCCRQTPPMRGSVVHDTEHKSSADGLFITACASRFHADVVSQPPSR